ncbi:MAG: hypothetical protein ROO76_10070 [Terriglobia bacterium]|nr:hypothetical protein [Terriglobia bacterium]
MKQSLRKGNENVHITYGNNDYTNNLIACNFTLEADESRIVLSMDFSASERTRSKASNTYLDVQELIAEKAQIKFFQISTEKWLGPLLATLDKFPNASLDLETRFMKSPSRTYRCELRTDASNLTFEVLKEGR